MSNVALESSETREQQPFTIFFDAECPFCVREVRMLQRVAERRGRTSALRAIDVSDPDFDAALFRSTRETFMARIHGQRPDGAIIEGMEVFRRAYAAAGIGWVVGWTGWPVLRPICDLGYRVFARYRVGLGRLFGRRCDTGSCELPARDPTSN